MSAIDQNLQAILDRIAANRHTETVLLNRVAAVLSEHSAASDRLVQTLMPVLTANDESQALRTAEAISKLDAEFNAMRLEAQMREQGGIVHQYPNGVVQ